MIDIILSLILVLAVATAVFCIYRAKKNGKHCIGCPHSGKCGGSACGCVPVNKADSDEK